MTADRCLDGQAHHWWLTQTTLKATRYTHYECLKCGATKDQEMAIGYNPLSPWAGRSKRRQPEDDAE